MGRGAKQHLWLFPKNGIQLPLIGAIIGMVASFYLLNLFWKMLPLLPGMSPQMVVAVAAFLGLIAVIASWLPARRTTRVNPIVALGSE